MQFLEETLNFEKTMEKHNIGVMHLVPDYVFFQIAHYQGTKTHQLAAVKGMEKIPLLKKYYTTRE
ncbi:hypothetical protein [Isobaculum melis]|uniref:Uncharacterized protein n=1 Tax=Isobaculum melis TaxID=142588 RepID=A0A1H9QWV5_9LACT|nr:hypothetical protein [Isobaculum melis]SER64193.1 hypothetical protein SAMN04488559_102298 [Isobaculum melis]